jgi:hypothetical protein
MWFHRFGAIVRGSLFAALLAVGGGCSPSSSSSSGDGSSATGGARAIGGSSGVGGDQSGRGGAGGGSTGTGGGTNSGGAAGGATATGGSAGTGVGGAGAGGARATGGASGATGAGGAGTTWNSPSTGNPIIPGYFADPSVFYDSATRTFYIYSTTDGSWITYAGQPTVWYSTDFVSWKHQALVLPAIWPTQPLWAPSVIKHPTTGRYYLLYAIQAGTSGTYVASSASPLGPWVNATAGTTTATAPLYKSGDMWGPNDGFDAQFFGDTDGSVYMTFGGGGLCGVAKLAFDANNLVTVDNTDTRMTNGTIHKFKQLAGLTNYLEGSVMFKNGNRYFIAYSNSACQNYNVQYAVASSPVGPFTHVNGTILNRDNAKSILGPGHNSVLQYGNNWYIFYHRQHYQYVDVKRQVCVDQITFNGDNISLGVQTPAGVWAGTGSLESLVSAGRNAAERDLAFGRPVLASSESDYQGGMSGTIPETFAPVKGFYAGKYAVDQNYGTRWAPTTLPGNLIVDLGADTAVGRTETTFELVLRAYQYRIEYLASSEAATLAAAQASTAWHGFADRSANTQSLSPVVDTGAITARYLRITVLAAPLPTAAAEIRTIIQTDFADRVSIVEFKAFASSTPP